MPIYIGTCFRFLYANALYIGTCFRFYTQMRVEKKDKAFAYRIYSHFTQQCIYSEKATKYNEMSTKMDILSNICRLLRKP